MALDQGVVDGVTNANFKVIAETPAIVANVANQNLIAHQGHMFQIAEASIGQILNKMNGLDPAEAASISGVVRSDMGKDIAALGAAVAGLQQMMKGAQSTPPETATGT